MSRALSSAVTTAIVICGVIGVVVTILQNVVYDSPYEEVNTEKHFAKQTGLKTVVVSREFLVNKTSDFHVTREVVKCDQGTLNRPPDTQTNVPSLTANATCDGGTLVRAQLESTDMNHEASPLVKREHYILELKSVQPPGQYQLLSRICWPVNLLRTDCKNLTALTLEIEIVEKQSSQDDDDDEVLASPLVGSLKK